MSLCENVTDKFGPEEPALSLSKGESFRVYLSKFEVGAPVCMYAGERAL